MKAFLYATMILLGIMASTGAYASTDPSETAPKPAFTQREFQCAVRAAWNEGGSTFATLEEQILMIHTMVVRLHTRDWYHRRDWQNEHDQTLCGVIYKRFILGNGRVLCQYTFTCPGYLNENPYEFVTPAACTANADRCALAKRSILAATIVLKDGWTPDGEMARADTYWSKCGNLLGKADCTKHELRVYKASSGVFCWFDLEEKLIPGQLPVPEAWQNTYYRALTLDEVRANIHAVPESCTDSLGKVRIVHEAQREWLDNPDRPPVVADDAKQKPSKANNDRSERKRHRRHRRRRR